MGDVPVPGYKICLKNRSSTLKFKNKLLVQQYSDTDAQLKQLFKMMGDIENVVEHTPASVRESAECAANKNAAEENGASCY
jgi:hypothetical protein